MSLNVQGPSHLSLPVFTFDHEVYLLGRCGGEGVGLTAFYVVYAEDLSLAWISKLLGVLAHDCGLWRKVACKNSHCSNEPFLSKNTQDFSPDIGDTVRDLHKMHPGARVP